MLEDKLLVWRFKRGSREALCRIYEKYRDDLLRLAAALLNERSAAEDIVHDVFTCFVRSAGQFELTGSLRGYLATCVANRARNVNRARQCEQMGGLDEADSMPAVVQRPDQWIICNEEFTRLSDALARLPYEQREAVILRLQVGMTFREVARLQKVSIKTVQSRCRYALDKLRALLDSEVEE